MRWVPALIFAVCASQAIAETRPLPAAWGTRERDFDLQQYMIPMRDGTKLATYVFTPVTVRDGATKLPLILERSPYLDEGLANYVGDRASPRLADYLDAEMKIFTGGDYIVILQDLRGRGKSEGKFRDQQPPQGPCNPGAAADETTDAYDTIDWLVENLPGNNGKVGLWGVSYSGWTAAMALVKPHPALKAVAPMYSPINTWIGDDYFHNGAFRQSYVMNWAYAMDRSRDWTSFPFDRSDMYEWFLREGTARDVHEKHMWPSKSWSTVYKNPNYDFWQCYDFTRYLPRDIATRVSVLSVHSWFDAEDIYGPITLHRHLEPGDKGNTRNYLLAGPWVHGGWFQGGASLGALQFGSDTGDYAARKVVAPFFAQHLKGEGGGPAQVAVFETGANEWRQYATWPPSEARPLRLYLRSGKTVSFESPAPDEGASSYVSDPASPVPYVQRPIVPPYGAAPSNWDTWLAADQRFADGRPDVLTFISPRLEADITVIGKVTARLWASTTGTDADWVVKLIDVYPDSDVSRPELRGYQLIVSGGIMRGRFRDSLKAPTPVAANTPLTFDVRMPEVNHRFRKGHRIMVQVQSTWFPLYDRNPQQFVPDIMKATAADLTAQRHTIHHSAFLPTHIELQTLR